MGVGVEQAKSSLFTRKSSGLVKTAGAFDVLAFNLSLISIGAAVCWELMRTQTVPQMEYESDVRPALLALGSP